MRLNWPLGPLIPEAGRSIAHDSPTGRAIRPFFLPAQEVFVSGRRRMNVRYWTSLIWVNAI
jgi:hypothetical protein